KHLVRCLNKGLGKGQRNMFNQTVRKSGGTPEKAATHEADTSRDFSLHPSMTKRCFAFPVFNQWRIANFGVFLLQA
ncbi:hypothetical protein, partial [Polycladidibacter hongkongensis]|uniref:hypothetical protein n=1 Tax=Polycladidibacter hongkongensis TaxID=1647556 RepID=UPI001FCAC6BD